MTGGPVCSPVTVATLAVGTSARHQGSPGTGRVPPEPPVGAPRHARDLPTGHVGAEVTHTVDAAVEVGAQLHVGVGGELVDVRLEAIAALVLGLVDRLAGGVVPLAAVGAEVVAPHDLGVVRLRAVEDG